MNIGVGSLRGACDPIPQVRADGTAFVGYPPGCPGETVSVLPDGSNVCDPTTSLLGCGTAVPSGSQWVKGVSNNTLLIAGGILVVAMFMGGRRR